MELSLELVPGASVLDPEAAETEVVRVEAAVVVGAAVLGLEEVGTEVGVDAAAADLDSGAEPRLLLLGAAVFRFPLEVVEATEDVGMIVATAGGAVEGCSRAAKQGI